MNFEFVEFYPVPNAKGQHVGTVHVYVIDIRMDIRGIKVKKQGSKVFFIIPSIMTNDAETGKKVLYPIVAWVEKKDKKQFMEFLHREAKPKVQEYFKNRNIKS